MICDEQPTRPGLSGSIQSLLDPRHLASGYDKNLGNGGQWRSAHCLVGGNWTESKLLQQKKQTAEDTIWLQNEEQYRASITIIRDTSVTASIDIIYMGVKCLWPLFVLCHPSLKHRLSTTTLSSLPMLSSHRICITYSIYLFTNIGLVLVSFPRDESFCYHISILKFHLTHKTVMQTNFQKHEFRPWRWKVHDVLVQDVLSASLMSNNRQVATHFVATCFVCLVRFTLSPRHVFWIIVISCLIINFFLFSVYHLHTQVFCQSSVSSLITFSIVSLSKCLTTATVRQLIPDSKSYFFAVLQIKGVLWPRFIKRSQAMVWYVWKILRLERLYNILRY